MKTTSPKGSLQNSKPGKLGKNSQPPLTPTPCGGWELCELGNNVRNLDPPPFPNLGTL